ncbi:MAG: NAD(+)/NADH kinase, partial [Promicromonosporaceae bacterium]|nr:NAD(+)/NADH kinase [Promicromonosporaceae bacterium]
TIYETTVVDPGTVQAEQALASGAELVIVAGGDGTVRATAKALAESNVPMAVLPIGTGNLLARNLSLPLTSIEEALTVALTGQTRAIDVGWMRVTQTEIGLDGTPRAGAGVVGDVQPFLVIAGLGFDAAMVTDVDAKLKHRFGWPAYFLAGLRHLHGRRIHAAITLDDGQRLTTHARSVMVGNCGRIPGGFTLLPAAMVDDGVLDVAAIDTRGGLAGWAQLFGTVALQGVSAPREGGRGRTSSLKMGRIDHLQARHTRIRVNPAASAQVDGDALGKVTEVEVWVDRQALLVRMPG